jgi:pimeloyl-ACP methyl ester carboxylesterase/DNA-binding CsgD family transcriptional regulator
MHEAIRYCTAADGVRLATVTSGRGPAIIKTANWLSHIADEPRLFTSRHWVAELARAHTLVRYDGRGCGLSDHKVADISADAWLRDLEAVADASGHARFVLFGFSQGAAAAVQYAVRHPQRVCGMVLAGSFARGVLKQGASARVEAAAHEMVRMAQLGWGGDTPMFRELFLARMFPDAPRVDLRRFDAAQRAVPGDVAARYIDAFNTIDIRADAASVRCPTLVLHSMEEKMVLPREGRLLASLIPGARFIALASANHMVLEHEPAWKAARDEVRAFLSAVARTEAGAAPPSLTPRQREVLRQAARGATDKEIARDLGLSPRTVEMHVARALAALGARNRTEAVGAALQHRLLD